MCDNVDGLQDVLENAHPSSHPPPEPVIWCACQSDVSASAVRVKEKQAEFRRRLARSSHILPRSGLMLEKPVVMETGL